MQETTLEFRSLMESGVNYNDDYVYAALNKEEREVYKKIEKLRTFDRVYYDKKRYDERIAEKQKELEEKQKELNEMKNHLNSYNDTAELFFSLLNKNEDTTSEN